MQSTEHFPTAGCCSFTIYQKFYLHHFQERVPHKPPPSLIECHPVLSNPLLKATLHPSHRLITLLQSLHNVIIILVFPSHQLSSVQLIWAAQQVWFRQLLVHIKCSFLSFPSFHMDPPTPPPDLHLCPSNEFKTH